MIAPLLELRDARIDAGERLVIEQLNLCSTAERVGLLGRGRAVFDALCGLVQLTEGDLLVGGVPFGEAMRSHRYACACPWPAPGAKRYDVTVFDGLVYSAMLAGCGAKEAQRRSSAALARLGLAHFAKQRLPARVGLEHYLAGLVEAALFDPEIVVVDWPIAVLTEEAWARYGTALSMLLGRRRFIAWVPGPARLPVERSWVGALDELLFLDGELSAKFATGGAHIMRILLVVAASPTQIQSAVDSSGLALSPVAIRAQTGVARAAFVVELAMDEFGRPCTETVLTWCDRHQLPIVRLEPLGGVC